MTKLTPARKALLKKLVDTGGTVDWAALRPSEKTIARKTEKAGLCHSRSWGRDWLQVLRITDAGRAALKEGTQ